MKTLTFIPITPWLCEQCGKPYRKAGAPGLCAACVRFAIDEQLRQERLD